MTSTKSPTNKTTVVDRTIHQIIPPSLLSSSSQVQNNISAEVQFLHKIHGTSILYQTTKLLRLSPSVYATSTTIFHRFYHRSGCTLDKYDVWSVSLGSVLLACKVEEEIRRIQEIILVFVHVYRRMRMGVDASQKIIGEVEDIPVGDGSNGSVNADINANFTTAQSGILKGKTWTREEKMNVLRYIRPLPQYGTLYQEWQETIMEMENIILREMGFTLYWIPGMHPHVFLLYFLKVLELDEREVHKEAVAQKAWNYCNDSCRIDLCVLYQPELVTCAAIHLACFDGGEGRSGMDTSISLPLSPKPWWHAFLGPDKDDDLSVICNALMALGDRNCVSGFDDAMNRYVVSLVDGGSFCDPNSFSWNALD